MLEKLTPAAHMLRLRGSKAAAEQLQLRQQQDKSNSSGGGAVVGNNTTKAALSPLPPPSPTLELLTVHCCEHHLDTSTPHQSSS